ncbi:MAG: HAMP domain-containing protein [Sphingomonadales bacterium]|nr:HAMP domain-containing protein [Sphingomonadales bacterium]
MLLAIALAVLLAQAISAALLYRAQSERRDAALIHTAALRLLPAARGNERFADPEDRDEAPRQRGLRPQMVPVLITQPGDRRDETGEAELQEVLGEQGIVIGEVRVFRRSVAFDKPAQQRLARRDLAKARPLEKRPRQVLIAAIRIGADQQWLVARVLIPPAAPWPALTLIGQTLLLFGLIVGALALMVGRITRPLARLTTRLDHFARHRDTAGQLEPEGPDDVRRLIAAHNVMEDRIAALLDEKDVMLGAIGHDLKTPLAALRVRIESVDDETERAKMAATIEDITRSLDDILSLARVGRPSDPLEATELNALVGQIAEEFEDMGEPVSFTPTERTVIELRATWVRRAVRNLVVNALRYGGTARIALHRQADRILIAVDDDGPGIPADRIHAMLEPFTRGEPSRSSTTGGAGLGLTLARAIADQHGGTLHLINRQAPSGAVEGLTATLALPLAPAAI